MADLKLLKIAELRLLAKNLGVKPKGTKKEDLIASITSSASPVAIEAELCKNKSGIGDTRAFSQIENAPIIQKILQRLDYLEKVLSKAPSSARPPESDKLSIEQGVFDDIVLGIYREIRARPNQAVPIAQVWARLSSRHPDVPAGAFTRLLLKSTSPKFHLEQGTGEFQVKDPASGKVFGYLIGS